jgi:competence protein ComEC
MDRGFSPKFSTSPLLWLAICFAVGALVQHFSGASLIYAFAIGMMSGIGAVLSRFERPVLFLVPLMFVAAGATSYSLEIDSVRSDRIKNVYDKGTIPSGSPVEMEGTLARSPDPTPDGEILLLSAERLSYRAQEMPVHGNVRLLLINREGTTRENAEDRRLVYGSRIRVACNLEREDEYLNPGVLTRRKVLDRMGVDATATVKSPLLIEHIADESVLIPLAWIYSQRSYLIDAFEKNLGTSAAGVMTASLLGNKHYLDKSTAEIFREGGTFHILVISGLHITFIGGLLLGLLRTATRNRWIQSVITAGALWSYTFAVGADTPVVRASLMFTAVLYAYVAYRRAALLNMLGLCALLLLAWQPSSVLDPSFQLTFVSVLSIAALGYPLLERLRSIGAWTPTPAQPFPPSVSDSLRRLCETLYWQEQVWDVQSERHIWKARIFKRPFFRSYLGGALQKMAQWLFEALLISLTVQICMLPLSVIYFHRFSAGSVLLNLWVGFWMAIESFLAVMGAIFLLLTDRLALPFFRLAEAANAAMLTFPRLVEGQGFRVPEYPFLGRSVYVLHFLPLLFIAAALARWNPFRIDMAVAKFSPTVMNAALITIILSSAVIVLHPFSAPNPDGRLHIEFLDVGQGDSALITFPGGETALVDGGGRAEYRNPKDIENSDVFVRDVRGIGESVVSEVLWAKGYSAVDSVIATHADADHMQGLVDVVKNFQVERAFVGGTPHADPEFAEFSAMLIKRQVPMEMLRSGDSFSVSKVSVEVLHPSGEKAERSNNDQSVVLLLRFDGRRVLLTGDIEKAAEERLVRSGFLENVDLIKVAHHGSRTSSTSEFVTKVRPLFAIIPVGRRSPFGHPHPEVVNRWKSVGADVLTTGERGMITIVTDGYEFTIGRYLDHQ